MTQRITIQTGTTGFDVDSKKRISPKYVFRTTIETDVIGEETIGCGEYARKRLIILVEGKRISVPA